MSMVCRRCMRPLPGYAAFCPRCGMHVRRRRVGMLGLIFGLGLLGFFVLGGLLIARPRAYRSQGELQIEPWSTTPPAPQVVYPQSTGAHFNNLRIQETDGQWHDADERVERAFRDIEQQQALRQR